MEKLVVDRIVGDIAVLEKEDGSHKEVSVSFLPLGVKEGNVLLFDGENYTLDFNSESEARERILKKQRSIFKKRERYCRSEPYLSLFAGTSNHQNAVNSSHSHVPPTFLNLKKCHSLMSDFT